MLRELLHRFIGHWPTHGVWQATDGWSMPVVTASNSLRNTPVYRAVSLIANDVARTRATISDPTVDVLYRNPNRYQSAFEFRRAMTLQAALWGNAFALINRTSGGELIELMPLDIESVSLDLSGPEPLYRTSNYGLLPLSRVFHLRTIGYNGLWGESPVRLCNVALTVSAAQEQAQLKAMENGGQSKLAFWSDKPIGPAARQKIVEDYQREHSGSGNAGKPVVLQDGMRVERISSTLADAGMDAARQYSIEDVARIYGVPSHMLMSTKGTAYGSLEWAGRAYLDGALAAWFAAWEAEILAKLATPFDSCSFDTDYLIRPSLAEQMAALRTGVEAGFVTRNEAREWLDLAPLPGLDEPIVAKNMGTGGGQTAIGQDTSQEAGANEP